MHEEERGSKKEKWYSVVSEPDQGEKGYKNLSLKDVKEKALRKEKVRVVRAFKEQDCFEEHFEMANFPLDHQHLTIGVTTKWDHTVAAISFEQHQPTVNPSLHVSQTWEMKSPRLISYLDAWDNDFFDVDKGVLSILQLENNIAKLT